MAAQIADGLNAGGHNAISVKREAAWRGQSDPIILLSAAQQGRITVTHNERHFKLLHVAWLRWPLPYAHAGILVIPQRFALPADTAVEQLDAFAAGAADSGNRLFVLRRDPPGGPSYAWEEWLPR